MPVRIELVTGAAPWLMRAQLLLAFAAAAVARAKLVKGLEAKGIPAGQVIRDMQ